MIAKRIASPLVALSLFLAVTKAGADEPNDAQALFDEAKQLMAEGRYAEACPKFEQSQKIDPGLGTQFHLADCLQHTGRSATAWELFREVESQARSLGQEGRERVAHDRATALEPFVSKLTIALHEAASTPDLRVFRDGAEVGREQWDVPVPVDPGSHSVVVSVPHKPPWQTNVDVPGEGKTVTLDVPPLADVPDVLAETSPTAPPTQKPSQAQPPSPGAAAPQPPSPGAAAPMPPSPSVPETPILEDPGKVQRSVGWCIAGVGVVGLAASAYFTGQWIDTQSLVNIHCPGGMCDVLGTNLKTDAHNHAVTAVATLGGGATAFLLGGILVASAPRPRIVMSASGLGIAPRVGSGEAGLDLLGTW